MAMRNNYTQYRKKPGANDKPRQFVGQKRQAGGRGGMATLRNKGRKKKFWTFKVDNMPSIGTIIKKSLKLILIGVGSFIVLVLVSGFILIGYMYVNESDYFMVQPQSIIVSGL